MEEIKLLATVDSLTGLFNRRKFSEMMQLEFNRVSRYGRNASLFLLDINYFKQVNDFFGHQAGDQVLTEFTQLLQATARKSDIISRGAAKNFPYYCLKLAYISPRLLPNSCGKQLPTMIFLSSTR